MDSKDAIAEDSPLKIAYVGFILFIALGLVLNWIMNDSSDAKPASAKKPENF